MNSYENIGHIRPIKCTYPECELRFDTEKEMKGHKLSAPEHNYCKKCDLDCGEWEDFTQHKIDSMRPWLEGRMRDRPDVKIKHIACEFCGQDFKSFGGRRAHIDQSHQADQHISCEGCDRVFFRAGNYVHHLECGKCPGISKRDFQESVQQKHVVAQIMKDPQALQMHLNNSPAMTGSSIDTNHEDAQDTDEIEGDMALIDFREASQAGTESPRFTTTRKDVDQWPHLPNIQIPECTESTKTASTTLSPGLPIARTDMSASQFAAQITSPRQQSFALEDRSPFLHCSLLLKETNSRAETKLLDSSSTLDPSLSPLPWSQGSNTAQALFKNDTTTVSPTPGDWNSHLKNREEAVVTNSNNLLRKRFWDPNHIDYDPDLFLNHTIGKYCCPFGGCETEFDHLPDLEHHLRHGHLQKQYRCPACLKVFKSASALISHSEAAGGKCRVKHSNLYRKVIDDFSGGYLEVKHVPQPNIYRPETAPLIGGQPANGVMSAKFTTPMPK